jgi:ABC-type amino acid transport substrate-binding protein
MNHTPHRKTWCLLLLAALFTLALAPARAQTAAPQATPAATAPPAAGAVPLKVAVYVVPPFVIKTDTGYGGMAIDIWQDTASKLGLSYQYVEMPTFSDLLQAVSSGQVDIAVADISITQERMQRMDFTQPWYNSGLRVMINQDRENHFGQVLQHVYQSGHLRIFMWLGIVIIAAVFALTLIDRHFDEDFPEKWHEGIIESLYHVLSVVTSGKSSHKLLFGVWGRLIAAFWLICGVTVVAYVTSTITASMTVLSLNDEIHSAADLQGHTVGVVEGTVGESWCLDAGVSTQTFINLPAAVHALLRHQIAAIVGDTPALEYYDNSHPELPITEVGAIFAPSTYGFATPMGSKLARQVSV